MPSQTNYIENRQPGSEGLGDEAVRAHQLDTALANLVSSTAVNIAAAERAAGAAGSAVAVDFAHGGELHSRDNLRGFAPPPTSFWESAAPGEVDAAA